jgi:hypothetical protein
MFRWDYDTSADGPGEGMGPDGENPLGYYVGRDQTRHVIALIKCQSNDKVVAKIHVWIIWADGVPHILNASTFQDTVQGSPPGAYFGPWSRDVNSWQFVFTISPWQICDANQEIPKLTGKQDKRRDVPGAGKPYYTNNGYFADTADQKWDLSRQMRIVKNGALIVNYPGDDAEGNDDSFSQDKDEEDVPYMPYEGIPDWTHGVGQIVSTDGPFYGVWNSQLAQGATYSKDADFREFARVQLWDGSREIGDGRFWFRISDYIDWHHALRARALEDEDSFQLYWDNNGSSDGQGHLHDVPFAP